MSFNNFHKLGALVIATALVVSSSNAYAELTKEDVRQIVKEYIEENPDAILESMITKSKEKLKEKQDASLTTYKDWIFEDKGSPVAGNPKGDVTVVEFVDYNCGYCKKSSDAVAQLMEKDKNVRFVFKELPILGDSSKDAAKWALAANKQSKYAEYHLELMKNRRPITTVVLKSIADSIGLDSLKLEKDTKSEDVEKQIDKDYNLAVKMSLTGTPVFVIGDEIHFGALDYDTLTEKVAAYRAKKK